MQRTSVLATSLLMLCAGCASVPQCAPQQFQRPVLGPVPTESYLSRIEKLCCESVLKPTDSAPITERAASSSTR